MTTASTKAARWTAFEIINGARREIFVGVTQTSIFEAVDALRRSPPKALAHWEPAEFSNESLRSIEFNLAGADARAFIAHYVKSALPPGWRFLLDGGRQHTTVTRPVRRRL